MRVRTGYSFRHAAGRIEDVMARLREIGASAAPITDRASTFGFVKWGKLAQKNGLRPVFGVELAVTSSINEKKPVVDHWTFIAKDSIEPINRLVQLASQQFRYQPLLTYEQALAADAIKIAGHRCQFESMALIDDVYVGLSPALSKGQLNEALARGYPLVATSDNVFPREGDRNLYELVVGRNAEAHTYPQHLLSDDELKAFLEAKHGAQWASLIDRSMAIRNQLLERSVATLAQGSLLHPERPGTLKELCEQGAARIGCDLNRPEYSERLERELALIKVKDFEDYFYIISDLCRWARARMLVGPARGSSCGSLVCYLLEITTVDPIPFGLIFERFIDINRNDLPDIDIDFSDQNRDQIYGYMEKKYGKEHIAKLGTVAMYKPRSALQEAGMAFKIPRWRLDAFADTIIERSSGDSRALQTMEDSFAANDTGRGLLTEWPELVTACSMEGHPRHHSTHAAGIVVTDKPVIQYVAIDEKTGSTHCDKKDAEDLNLLKIDALGLTQLSIFEDALELAGLPRLHLETIPRDCPSSFKVLNDGHFAGVFQFNGQALQSLSRQITFDNLMDIVAVTALGRPGPLASGGATTWVGRKIGRMPVSYPHPAFEPYLADTLGVVMYQEQVMEIGRNIGDLTWEDVTQLRKAMSKSLGKEFFDKYGDRFKAGARAKGIPDEVLTKVWDDLCAYGAWAFNKSHSVAYGIISYYCCWLKAHHPVEFAAASLTHESDPDKQLLLLRELAAEGVDYIPIDAERSIDKWTVAYINNKKVLVGPLNNAVGMGPKMMQSVMSARARGEPVSERALKIMSGSNTKLNSLFPIRDRIAQLVPNLRDANIVTEPTALAELEKASANSEHVVLVCAIKIAPRDENEEVNVARRNGVRINDGMTATLNLRLQDDTGAVLAKISRFEYAKIGKAIVDRGGAGKALYALKGKLFVRDSFRMLMVKQAKYLGDMT